MNRIAWAIIFAIWLPSQAWSQGIFSISSQTALTRVGSLDGPLAGPAILGQALVGATEGSLSPLGPPRDHMFGLLRDIALAVPGVFAGQDVFVQMAAWDGTVWGDSLAGVPANQIGYTDIVPVILASPTQPYPFPEFTRSAVVPPVPEPNTVAMIIVGWAVLMLAAAGHRRRPMGRI